MFKVHSALRKWLHGFSKWSQLQGTGRTGQHVDYFLASGASLKVFRVAYSCGACGYVLNLSSSNRNTTDIITSNSKYAKSIKKGIISFFSIDESRFIRANELCCRPYFTSARSWGLFRRRTRLLCRKCGVRIGYVTVAEGSLVSPRNIDWNGVAGDNNNAIRIAVLQPSEDDPSGVVECTEISDYTISLQVNK